MATRTRTVVFTDLTGYTASVGRADREAIRNLVAAHEKMVAPVLEEHGGRVVKNIGDSYMALFRAATDAVRAGLELVDTITDPTGFSIRVSMATGDVEVIDGDAFGDAVNLASRILQKAAVGEVWFSPATQLCMNQAEIAWEAVGRYTLKGIPAETAIYRAVPGMRAWLPEPVAQATRTGKLVRIQRGDPMPSLPPDPIILLEGFAPGTKALRDFVDRLPVLDPACLWLVTYTIALSDRIEWERLGRGLVVGLPVAVERALQEVRRPTSPTGSDTIILDVSATAVIEVIMSGLALPAVPMSEVVAGYTYDMLADGRWVNQSDQAIARVDVNNQTVRFTALASGFMVNGRQVAPGAAAELEDADEVVSAAGRIQFRAIDSAAYVGLLVAETQARIGIAAGQQAEVGREPRHPGLPLPDRRGQENIRWCLGNRAARARESGFTLDRALAGRRQCAICLGPTGASVISLHAKCPTYVVNGRDLDPVSNSRPVVPGDLVIAGTSVVAIREPTG